MSLLSYRSFVISTHLPLVKIQRFQSIAQGCCEVHGKRSSQREIQTFPTPPPTPLSQSKQAHHWGTMFISTTAASFEMCVFVLQPCHFMLLKIAKGILLTKFGIYIYIYSFLTYKSLPYSSQHSSSSIMAANMHIATRTELCMQSKQSPRLHRPQSLQRASESRGTLKGNEERHIRGCY